MVMYLQVKEESRILRLTYQKDWLNNIVHVT